MAVTRPSAGPPQAGLDPLGGSDAVFRGRGVNMNKAVFIDKDGTLVENVPHNVDPEQVSFAPHALEAARRLVDSGYKLIVITNQPGLAERRFERAALTQLMLALAARMAEAGAPLTDFFVCPHAAASGCLCRKPAPGLLHQAARAHGIDLAESWMVGDILDDVEAGARAGCRTVLLDVGNETQWRGSPLRTPLHRASDWLAVEQAILSSAVGWAEAHQRAWAEAHPANTKTNEGP